MIKDDLEKENNRLRKAILELVYEDKGRWFVGRHGDSDVTDIVGDLLADKPKR